MRILIVDDELVSRMKMRKILESIGTCETGRNGMQAIAAFRVALESRQPFDLITLDIEMPEMDGTEVLCKIKEIENQGNDPKGEPVKILMVTSQSDKKNVLTCIQAGCDNYIIKPFDKKKVFKKLQELGFQVSLPG
jgi:two-component system chemotaxis response regulator CheY